MSERKEIKVIETGAIENWTVEEIVNEINRDRSGGWQDYTKEDWKDGWNEWCEGQYYELIERK